MNRRITTALAASAAATALLAAPAAALTVNDASSGLAASNVRVAAQGALQCTGTVVAPQWVLTDADCVNQETPLGSVFEGEGAGTSEVGINAVEVDPKGRVALVHVTAPLNAPVAPVGGELKNLPAETVVGGWDAAGTDAAQKRAEASAYVYGEHSGASADEDLSWLETDGSFGAWDQGGMVVQEGKVAGVTVVTDGFFGWAAPVADFQAWMAPLLLTNPGVTPGDPGSLPGSIAGIDIGAIIGGIKIPAGSLNIDAVEIIGGFGSSK